MNQILVYICIIVYKSIYLREFDFSFIYVYELCRMEYDMLINNLEFKINENKSIYNIMDILIGIYNNYIMIVILGMYVLMLIKICIV